MGLLIAASASAASAQVKGVCVSNCNIPNPQQQSGPQLDPRLLIVGLALEVQGEVAFVYPNGDRTQATAQTPIAYGTRIITGPGGRIVFRLSDETSWHLGSGIPSQVDTGSELIIDRWVYEPDADLVEIVLRLAYGKLRWITGSEWGLRPHRFELQLDTLSLATKGTDFEVVATQKGSGTVVLHEGEIEVRPYGTGDRFDLHRGQTLRWENFKIVSGPSR